MSVYLDASVLVALLNVEDHSEAAFEFIQTQTGPLFVSEFARGEVSSAISRLLRMNAVALESASERLQAFDEWVIAAAHVIPTEAADVRLAAQFVRRFALGLRLPDAIHLAAAQQRNLTLATLDRRLAHSAEQLGIHHVVPT